ncbi:Nucleotide-binding universal stress protein, UspA family [Asanoa ishikariensis]|uniref:Nucleotide-binding universal stress protein, UspA family n=1 Tax=Asanoa ishikariensis TaxID=137265 RepID=A0A1H3UJ09_9ACTN|nr:universal stress protein [Asanoa ishikariensis]SDZ62400.1 Nucleotide-binding universal stress protein, UspA family [Asanoa ishikariensis]
MSTVAHTVDNREIVVGTDGSPCATAAVRWAAEEAALREVPLRVLLAHDTGPRFGGEPGLHPEQVDAILDAGADAARRVDRDLDVRPQQVVGWAVPALLNAAGGAGMLVVGSRGHGGFASLLLGSVCQQVASRAPCAVAMVREGVHAGPVVVGSDGSEPARGALAVGFRLADERHAPLLAVRAYYPPTPPLGYGYQSLVHAVGDLDQATADRLAGDLRPWRQRYPTVRVDTAVVHGSAAGALVEQSRDALAVVVGSHGRGRVTGALHGSVGPHLLRHARCPVMVTHERQRAAVT